MAQSTLAPKIIKIHPLGSKKMCGQYTHTHTHTAHDKHIHTHTLIVTHTDRDTHTHTSWLTYTCTHTVYTYTLTHTHQRIRWFEGLRGYTFPMVVRWPRRNTIPSGLWYIMCTPCPDCLPTTIWAAGRQFGPLGQTRSRATIRTLTSHINVSYTYSHWAARRCRSPTFYQE